MKLRSELNTHEPEQLATREDSACDSSAAEYVNKGVQVSLVSTTSSYVSESTPPPSPVTRSPSQTPRPKRKHWSKAFMREGERQAQELEDELRFVTDDIILF